MGLINNILMSYKIKKAISEKHYKEAAKMIENLEDKKLKEKWKFKLQFESENFKSRIEELEVNEEYEKVLRLLSTLYDSKYKTEYTDMYIKKLYALGYNCYANLKYAKAKKLFGAIVDYKESGKLFKFCHNKELYHNAVILLSEDKVEEAYKILLQLDNFENTKELKEKCKQEIEYKKALNYFENKQYKEAAAILNKNSNYKNSRELIIKIEEEIKLIEAENKKTEEPLLVETNTNEVKVIKKEKIEDHILLEDPSKEEIKGLPKVDQEKEDNNKKNVKPSDYYNQGVIHFNHQEYIEAKKNFILSENYKDSKKYLEKCEKEIKQTYMYSKYSYIFGKDKMDFVERNSLKLVIYYNKRNNKHVYCACFENDEKPHKEFYLALAKSKLEKIKKENTYLLMDSEFYIIYCSTYGNKVDEGVYIYKYSNSNISQIDDKIFINSVSKMSFVDDVDELLKNASKKTSDILECVKAYTGELDLYKSTREKLDSISELIENSLNVNEELKILIQGSARSGKTIIALQLLRFYSQFKFLLMNYHFYISLREAFKAKNLNFPTNRIFHHDLGRDHGLGCGVDKGTSRDGYIKKFKFSTDYVVVDEAQRLCNLKSGMYTSFAERDILVLNSKIGIFLGDDLQKINPEFDEGFEGITKKLKEKNRKYYNYEFDGSIGIPSNLVNAYKYVLYNNDEYLDYINENKIVLYNNSRDFKKDFDNNEDNSKHYSTITNYNISYDFTKLGLNKLPYNESTNNLCFLNKKYINHYILNTFDVISRDLHHMYLIIPDEISYSNERGIYHRYGSVTKYTAYLINHLYVNMTRATKRLVIYTADAALFNYLEKQIKKVCSSAEIINNPEKTVEEQKLNYVKSYSDKSDNNKLIEKWKQNNFEGFVHATDYENVIKILKENKLKSRVDVTGLFQDIADQDVIIKTSKFVTSKVRFYYAPCTPTLYHFNKRSNNLVILIFNKKLVNNCKSYYSDGNAASQYTKITGDIKDALKFDWDSIFSRGSISRNNYEITRKRNAELLVDGPVKVDDYIDKIVVQSSDIEKKIRELFPKYSDKIKTDRKYFN